MLSSAGRAVGPEPDPFVHQEMMALQPMPQRGITGSMQPDQLKKLRQRLAMTQRVFAKTFDVGYTALRRWEYGDRKPSGPARSLLKIIDKEPEAALRALVASGSRHRITINILARSAA